MSLKPPPGLTEDDFDSIEDAVMETARGRWFLREFSRRARAADTGRLLEALSRIEQVISGQTALPGGYAPEHHAQALDQRQVRFSEIAWTLRERGYDGSICTLIENEARALGQLAQTMRGDASKVERSVTPAVSGPDLTRAPVVHPVPSPPALAAPVALIEAMPTAHFAPPQPAHNTRDRRLEALADIDRLPARDKVALFA